MPDPLTMAATAFGLAKGIWPIIKEIIGRNGVSPAIDRDEDFKTSWEGRPASLANYFVGRKADVDRITEAMSGSGAVVISGGAGLGKSRLAAQYTYESESRGFWTSAGGTAVQTRAALAPRLGIDAKDLNDEQIAAKAGQAVAALPPGIVWVIDNLPEFGQVNDLLASASNLTLLITTRDSRRNLLPPTMDFLPLTLLEPEAAVDLLRSRGADKADEVVLKEIADIVGYLPMALEMLAARLGEPLTDAASVLAELIEAPNPLLMKAFQDAAGKDLGKPEGVYSAIIGTLNGLAPETRRAISPFGYLADEPVPLSLASALTGLDKEGLGQVLTECARQSVLSAAGDQITVHALTASAIAITNDDDALDRAISSDITRIAAINTDDPVTMRGEVAHHEALHIHAKREKTSENHSTLDLSNNLAGGYRALGRTEEAVKLDEETLEARERLLGPEHLDTLTSRNGLALGYWALGRTKEAVKMDEKTLEIRVRVIGVDHPDTLKSRNNLAIGYSELGRIKEAVKLDKGTLKARVMVLGPMHPHTLMSQNNLAVGYAALGRTAAAVKIDKETLKARVMVLGPMHPHTLMSRNNLAGGYRASGLTEEAVKLDEETLAVSMRVLGPEHPDTLHSRSNLALGYRALGRAEEAVRLDEGTLEARVRVLGPENPHTLTSWRNLITSYRAAGRAADADALAADERFPTAG
ncbi:MAG: hypothetical protein BZY87_00010 [SAR202 cluster bacterium Io17-Chloro-G6]|nr:MAG: hypothetical protein BZY87_00010 [SAR202 cluster bacterium Io17-Chloro-G6]